jgi:hypothetical protein
VPKHVVKTGATDPQDENSRGAKVKHASTMACTLFTVIQKFCNGMFPVEYSKEDPNRA